MNRRTFLQSALALLPSSVLARLPLSEVHAVENVETESSSFETALAQIPQELALLKMPRNAIYSKLIAGEHIPPMTFVCLKSDGMAYRCNKGDNPIGVSTFPAKRLEPVTVLQQGVVDGYPDGVVYYGMRVIEGSE